MKKETITSKRIVGTVLSFLLFMAGCATTPPHRPSFVFDPNSKDPYSGPGPTTPAEEARLRRLILKSVTLDNAARTALDAKNYAVEENYARQSVALSISSGLSEQLLAQALRDQGKYPQALQAYKVLIVDHKNSDPDNQIPYALLLLRSGQWSQAVGWANDALERMGSGNKLVGTPHFLPSLPQPTQMAVDLHIAQGLLDQQSGGWGSHARLEEGMREFAEARHLAPQSDLANYYYGYGWQHLDPKSPTRVADAAQAKAALRKAAASEDSSIKRAAQQALGGMRGKLETPGL